MDRPSREASERLEEKITEIICVGDILNGIVEAVGECYSPENVFDEADLCAWAESNGYVKAE